jgi:hypothetical protein
MKNGYRIGPIAKTQPMNSCEKGPISRFKVKGPTSAIMDANAK